MAEPVIELAPSFYRVPTLGSAINSYLFIEPDGSITLIDTGTKQAPKKIIAAIKHLNKDLRDVRKILFTHSHDDHAGGAGKLLEVLDNPIIYAHKEEIEFLESGKNPPRDFSHFAGFFFRLMPSGGYLPIKVNEELEDRQVLPIAGGLQVIHTPGHTPGHVSFLHQASQTLITGDSVFNFGFKLSWSLSAFCTDFNQSKRTAEKFLDLDFETAAFTHGPHIKDGGKSALKKFLKN